MGADAAAFSALSERVAKLEENAANRVEELYEEVSILQAAVARLHDEVFGKSIHEEVLGEVKPPEPRLEQPKRTR